LNNNPLTRRFPSQLIDRTLAYLAETGEMMIQLELAFPHPLDGDRLARAAVLALAAEPVLGCRFVDHWRKPYWEEAPAAEREVFVEAQTGAEFEAFKVASIETYSGPRLRVCLWNSVGGASLLIKVCHYVADAAGTRDVGRLLSILYNRLNSEPTYQLEPNLAGTRGIEQILQAVPWRNYPGLFRQAIHDAQASQKPPGAQTLPIQSGPAESLSFVHRLLPQAQVTRLVEYGRKRHATLNELLLAAFFRAMAATSGWDGYRQLRVTTTVDLRRYLEGRQASAISNLSLGIQGWPSLGTDLGDNFGSTLQKVTAITQRRKGSFVGVDALLMTLLMLGPLPHHWGTKLMKRHIQQLDHQGNTANTFTNLGPIASETITFGSKPAMARLLPPPVYPPYFMLGVSGYEGTLTLSSGIYTLQRGPVERFLEAMVDELKQCPLPGIGSA
jgi:NRPS condensation-like uncharacterized protein